MSSSSLGRHAACHVNGPEDDILDWYAIDWRTAEDVTDLGDSFEVPCEPTDLVAVRTALQESGIEYDSVDALFVPSVTIEVDVEAATKTIHLIDALDGSDEVMEQLEPAE